MPSKRCSQLIPFKFMLVNLLICSDFITISGFFNYCSSANPSHTENAKKQLISGLVVNVLVSHILLIIHLFGGVDLSSYSKLEWSFLAVSLVSFVMFSIALLGLRINAWTRTEVPHNKIQSCLLIVAIVSVLISTIAFQLFLVWVTL